MWDWLWNWKGPPLPLGRAGVGADASRARRDELVDKLAASYILRGAIDGLVAGLE